jgi:hypothetical protein
MAWEFSANRGKFWDLNLAYGARLEINYINIYYCHSIRRVPIPYSPQTGNMVNADPYYLDVSGVPASTHYFNINWIKLDQFYYSYTEDADQNGKVDRLRLQSAFELFFDDNEGGARDGFDIRIEGYEIDRSKGVDGSGLQLVRDLAGPGTNKSDSIYVFLKEKDYSDGDAVLRWEIRTNKSLKERTTGTTRIGRDGETGETIDTVPPRINYALALPGKNEIFVQFSEPVSAPPGFSIGFAYPSGSFPGTLPGRGIGVTKLNDREYLLKVTDPGFSFDIAGLAGGLEHFLVRNAADLAERAYDVNYYYSDNPQYPVPSYPMDWRYHNYMSVRYDDHPLGALVPQNRLAGLDRNGDNYFELTSDDPPGTPTPKELPAPLPEVYHRVTDVLISVPPASAAEKDYFVWPVWAKDSDAAAPDPRGADFPVHSYTDSGVVWDFTGKGSLRHRDITIQARRNPGLGGLELELYYANTDDSFRAGPANGPEGLWLPWFDTRDFSNIVPKPRPFGTPPPLDSGPEAAPDLFNFRALKNSGTFENKKDLEFFFRLKNSSPAGPGADGLSPGASPLFAGRLKIDRGITPPADWYRLVRPFVLGVRDITLQRSGVTILNNVINPAKGEKTYVDYVLSRSGQVTVQVFTLDGTMVKSLRRQSLSAGEYRESWDGTNRGGRAVARGMYFIRVVGPDIDEIRKVMVVK